MDSNFIVELIINKKKCANMEGSMNVADLATQYLGHQIDDDQCDLCADLSSS